AEEALPGLGTLRLLRPEFLEGDVAVEVVVVGHVDPPQPALAVDPRQRVARAPAEGVVDRAHEHVAGRRRREAAYGLAAAGVVEAVEHLAHLGAGEAGQRAPGVAAVLLQRPLQEVFDVGAVLAGEPAAPDEVVGERHVLAARPGGAGFGELGGVEQVGLEGQDPENQVAVPLGPRDHWRRHGNRVASRIPGDAGDGPVCRSVDFRRRVPSPLACARRTRAKKAPARKRGTEKRGRTRRYTLRGQIAKGGDLFAASPFPLRYSASEERRRRTASSRSGAAAPGPGATVEIETKNFANGAPARRSLLRASGLAASAQSNVAQPPPLLTWTSSPGVGYSPPRHREKSTPLRGGLTRWGTNRSSSSSPPRWTRWSSRRRGTARSS